MAKVDRKTLYKEFKELWKEELKTSVPNKTRVYTALAEKYGYANHMSVYHAIRRIENKMESIL